MGWKFKDGIPIWTQIIDTIRQKIVRGDWPPGSKVPAVRELALEAGVNPNTMQRALSEMERDGLLYRERNSGRFVTENEQILKELRETLCQEAVQELLVQLGQLGLTPEEIREEFRRAEQSLGP